MIGLAKRGVDPTIGPPVETPAGQDETDYMASLATCEANMEANYGSHADLFIKLQDNPHLQDVADAGYLADRVHFHDSGYGYWAEDNLGGLANV